MLIGNAKYLDAVGPLTNPTNDAAKVKQTLMAIGFQEREIHLVQNASRHDTLKAVESFGRRLGELGADGLGFFYYSGHGAARADTGKNYLIPVDVKSADDEELWHDAVALDWVLETIGDKGTAPLFVIIDACRNELKLKRKALGSSEEKGFQPINARAGLLIAFAADEKRTARDRVGQSATSPYAEALAQELVEPERDAVSAFGFVRPRVLSMTEGLQAPIFVSKLNRAVYFVSEPKPIKPATAAPFDSARIELEVWVAAEDNCQALQDYLRQYPAGRFASAAKGKIAKLCSKR